MSAAIYFVIGLIALMFLGVSLRGANSGHS